MVSGKVGNSGRAGAGGAGASNLMGSGSGSMIVAGGPYSSAGVSIRTGSGAKKGVIGARGSPYVEWGRAAG